MCGIAGKVSVGPSVDPALLDRMCSALRHRGPDSQGVHLGGAVGLGIRRLAIIDLVHGDQPLYSEDRSVALVLNGEIYNHEELRAELRARGHRFASGSDAEVVVHLWEEIGPRCIHRLRGMYAFALWDARSGELFLARDRVGKKPLYYASRPDALTFGSEPRAVLEDPAVSRAVDLGAIDAFLVNQYVPHDMCAFRELRKLPPASTLRWRPGHGAPAVERYWRLAYAPKQRVGMEEAAERLRAELLEATRLRLRSDVPLGAFLSGGVDSSLVVAAMARSMSEPVKTFSVAFPGTAVDETRYARRMAARYGTDHHELQVGAPDPDLLVRLAWHFGEPFADPAALPTYQLSQLIRDHVTVALNGDGGDESFAGYARYRQLMMTLPADRVGARVRDTAAAMLARVAGTTDGRSPLPRAARLARRLALDPARRYADLFRFFTVTDRPRVYGDGLREAAAARDPLEHVVAAWDRADGLHPVDRLMATDLETYLADDLVSKVDVTSMAHSVEVRSPLLDTELMSWAATLPPALKGTRREGKRLLREAARPWVDADILDRPKQGFAVPVADWLRGPMRSLCEDALLDPEARARDLFVPREVEALLREHRDGRDRAQQLWAMLMLELWFRTCVDHAPATAPASGSLAPRNALRQS
jgi:asparagine synthase (glutamine-hydrolysing)